jgi:hypothetical protein
MINNAFWRIGSLTCTWSIWNSLRKEDPVLATSRSTTHISIACLHRHPTWKSRIFASRTATSRTCSENQQFYVERWPIDSVSSGGCRGNVVRRTWWSRGGNILSNNTLYNSVTYHFSQFSSFLYRIQTVIQHDGTTTDELYISIERGSHLLQTPMYQA